MIRPSALPLLLLVVAACVGSDPPAGTTAPGSSGDPGAIDSGAVDGAGGEHDAASPDAASPDATDAASSDAGLTRAVNCDAKSSCKGTQKCCGVGTDWINAACKDDCGGAYELTCDDASDCGTARVCCFVSDGGARVARSYCKAACTAAEGQLCDPSAEPNECTGTLTCTPFSSWSPSGLARCQ